MKVGDLIKVKDLLGYNSYMQQIAGCEGILLRVSQLDGIEEEILRCSVFIRGKNWVVWADDIEVICEGR
jgi:hypothetical protein